ncbi:phosphotransferase [Streptomyces sp. DSM 44915]|uniref:Phosphotransferase n=1 Tax=Streptomyces chisholmiae TaxID=3075540 RepID=A0ABU2JNM5_9ACTN|nr:phosphotransferase [Streptomyces sp. DSM 44915]MDT0266104.1 phosphotransferase [Streptomyces sp. DSM 44915]
MGTFQDFLAAEFPGARVSELSGSNNTVFHVESDDGPMVVKHVTDTDIPLSYLADANARLAEFMPVQRVFRVCETERGDPFDAVFSEYLEGENLATLLERPDAGPTTEELVDHLCRFVLACRELPRLHDGFGLYKREAPVLGSHPDFVLHYARRYWGRARPFYEGTPVGRAVDAWLDEGLAAALRRHPVPYTVVSIDSNLKNFLVTPDGRIVVLNVPIAGHSTPAHAVGAISTHLRGREPHQPFLRAAAERLCPQDADLVPHFELWGLLGILSFYAVRHPDQRHSWRNWGSPVLLDEDFRGLVEGQILGSARS